MANTNTGSRAALERQWIPTIIFDDERHEARVYCANNLQAVAAVQVATEQGLTARRGAAPAGAPAPILIVVRDERLEVVS